MVLAFRIQSLSFGQSVIGIFPYLCSRCLIFLIISWLGRNRMFLIGFYEFGCFSLKSAKTFFLEITVPCGWGKFIWSLSIPPSKTQVLWKVFHWRLLTDQHIQNKGLHIFSMCTLCEKTWRIYSTFYFLNVLMLCIFGVGFDRSFLPIPFGLVELYTTSTQPMHHLLVYFQHSSFLESSRGMTS